MPENHSILTRPFRRGPRSCLRRVLSDDGQCLWNARRHFVLRPRLFAGNGATVLRLPQRPIVSDQSSFNA